MKTINKRGWRPVSIIRGGRPGSRGGAAEPGPDAGAGQLGPAVTPPRRADARRNRARVLEAAAAAFAADGPQVPLDEIARRAGVGAGTVHRHFASKEALIQAVVAGRVEDLAARARELAGAPDPGAAFYQLFAFLVVEGSASHVIGARLAAAGVDVGALIAVPLGALQAAVAALMARAQRAGAVRADIGPPEVAALMAGAVEIERHPSGGRRGVEILCDALRPRGGVGRPLARPPDGPGAGPGRRRGAATSRAARPGARGPRR
jgi:AcrR family transcriptional regulator